VHRMAQGFDDTHARPQSETESPVAVGPRGGTKRRMTHLWVAREVDHGTN